MSTYATTQTCRLLLMLLWGICLLLCPTRTNAQTDPLARGNLYYKTDDVSDRAAREYRNVIRRYAGKPQAEEAQYMLASYYHRKYYIMRDKLKKNDPSALRNAAAEYKRYTDRYYRLGTHKWLSDAFFNLALVYLEQGNRTEAYNELSKAGMSPQLDSSVYAYKIVWSLNYQDIIDGDLDATALSQYAKNLLTPTKEPAAIIKELTSWGQRNKTGRASE